MKPTESLRTLYPHTDNLNQLNETSYYQYIILSFWHIQPSISTQWKLIIETQTVFLYGGAAIEEQLR